MLPADSGSGTRSRAVVLLLIGAFTSSFIAPVSRISTGVPAELLLCLASFVAFFGHLAYFRLSFPWQVRKNRSAVIFAFLGGAMLTWAYVVFAWSIRESANELVPTVMFELYPFGVILFSNILLFREPISLGKLGWLILSLFGIGLLTTSAGDGAGVWTWDLDHSFVLAVISVVLLSFGMTCVSRSTRELGENPDAPITASLIARLGGFLATLPALFFLDLATVQANTETVAYVLFYGIVILTISNFAYYKGISISRTHLVNVVWYIAPVLSVLWLSLLGFGQLTQMVGIGAACIIVANLMINFSAGRTLSYRVTIVWILVVGTITTSVPGRVVEFAYFDAIAALLIFFALLYGFAIQRLNSSIERERQLVLQIVAPENQDTFDEEALIVVRSKALELAQESDAVRINALYAELALTGTRGVNLRKVEELIISKAQRLELGELFILTLTGGLVIFLSIYARPVGHLYDSFALIVSTAVVFTFFTLVDALERRKRAVLSYVKANDNESKQAYRYMISDKLLTHEPRAERFLIASLSVGLILLFHAIYFLR